MSLFHLVYVSAAVVPFSDPDLLTLLETSRRKNTEAEVTGLLLYRGGNFMQVLEGEEHAVRGTHERIHRDPRHRGLITLLRGPIEARTFPNWQMGFRNLDSETVRNTPGYSEFLNDDWMKPAFTENTTRTLRLLEVFRSNMR